ncbi:MAG: endopeptidase La [Treponema sp.]|nr:endopeptidase La [Candidatus Treponema equifaecale]
MLEEFIDGLEKSIAEIEGKKNENSKDNSNIEESHENAENSKSAEGVNLSENEEKSDSEENHEQPEIKVSVKVETVETEDNSSEKKGKRTRKISLKDLGADAAIVPVETLLPPKLLCVPVSGHPMFPGIFTPVMITAPEDVKTVEQAFDGDGFLGIVLLRDDSENARNEDIPPTIKDLYQVGTVARIIKKINLPDGGLNIFISTVKRFRIKKTLCAASPIVAAVEYLEDEEFDTFEVKALTRALISEMKEISENNPLFSEEMRLNMVNIDNPGKIADFVASVLNVDKKEQQKVLEQTNVRARMEQVLVFIKKDQDLLRIQKKIQNELNENFEKNQREYFLREEMKMIQEELGVGEDGSDYQKFKARIADFEFEGEVLENVENELEKFKLMDPSSSEYFVSRNFLELVCQLPWKDESQENYDLPHAYKVLERDHYGLDDVKKRIMEYLAVRKLKHDNKGSIMILVGPPGVGKTSIGHSIAEAMNKPFYRFSVGGMRDEAEIKGHRRTYVGAMPGKILQGLKISKTRSPVFLIDEVDKMGSSYSGGDPASALLEVLDPEQNINFRDNYLDMPFDISNVFFILTANTLDKIPEPLLDRAEIISLAGYIDQEKLEIAKKYLIPKNLVKNGLGKTQVKYTKDALLRIAEEYARESGVRHYEKCIDRIHRKLVTQILTGIPAESKKLDKVTKTIGEDEIKDLKNQTFTIEADDLPKYLGKPVFDESEAKKADQPGTCIGLAWTSMGGDTLLIESISFPSDKGGLQLTGQMGDVMKESAQIAMNWVKQYAIEHKIKNASWFERNTIHLHIPEGATPKDGPSAGITMATTLMSLLTGRAVKPNIAMTGELDLTGAVMPIGGLREKTVAAKRNGIKTIFIPKANERDLDDIPDHVKNGIKFIPVRRAMEVMTQVFQAAVKKEDNSDYGF